MTSLTHRPQNLIKKFTMAFALIFQHSCDHRNANLAIMSKNLGHFIPIAVHRLKFQEIPCNSLSMLHVVTAASPLKLLCTGCVCDGRTSFGCTLTSIHFALCARSRYLIGECGGGESMNECSFFVNLLHYGMYLLESRCKHES
jgi:hypothetical protein